MKEIWKKKEQGMMSGMIKKTNKMAKVL